MEPIDLSLLLFGPWGGRAIPGILKSVQVQRKGHYDMRFVHLDPSRRPPEAVATGYPSPLADFPDFDEAIPWIESAVGETLLFMMRHAEPDMKHGRAYFKCEEVWRMSEPRAAELVERVRQRRDATERWLHRRPG